MEYTRLKTGKNYRLCDLFSKDNKIIIPDLQRDYCWGNTNGKEQSKSLAYNFVTSLSKNNFSEDFNLGLIYGYEAPLGHIQLCDGQQRITTLFLLLGMLNKKVNGNFEPLLISEDEKKDDYEPYLQYAIRESSLYFLSDLVRYFFMGGNSLCVADIEKQSWYFMDYDYDPSIVSMKEAMADIESLLKDCDREKCVEFGKYVSKKLSFLYFDMGNRKKGEETFVVINTTGEPLSPTENLKPVLIYGDSNDSYDQKAREWERWEHFFWTHRDKDKESIDTADYGMKEFFRWIMLLENSEDKSLLNKNHKEDKTFEIDKFDSKGISFAKVKDYFEIINNLYSDFGDSYNFFKRSVSGNSLELIDLFQILPIIEYCKRNRSASFREKERVLRFFSSLSKNENVSKSVTDLLYAAVQLVKKLPNSDIASALKNEEGSKTLINEEMKKKIPILVDCAKDDAERMEWEDLFWKEEDFSLWDGEIEPLLNWSTVDNVFSIDLFNKYKEKFRQLFILANRDFIIRALLSKNPENYPRSFGDTHWYLCFGASAGHWKLIVKEQSRFIKDLLDSVDFDDINASLDCISKQGNNPRYQDFIDNPRFLSDFPSKQIAVSSDVTVLMPSKKKVGKYISLTFYKLLLELNNEHIEMKQYSPTVIYVDFDKDKQYAIDIVYLYEDVYELQLFCRDKQKDPVNEFAGQIKKFALVVKECDELGRRCSKTNLNQKQVAELLKQIIIYVKS